MQKSVWNVFWWYVKVCIYSEYIYIFWKFIQYTIQWDKTKVKKKAFRQNKRYQKMHSYSWAPTYHSLTTTTVREYLMCCAIWYHLYNLKKTPKNTHGNTPLWVFFMFFKLYKWYQIGQNITNFRLWFGSD